MSEQIPLLLETTYMELLRLHGLRPLPDHYGSLMKVRRGSVDGWVVRRRAGNQVRETWICAAHQKNASCIAKLKKDLDDLARWKRKTSSVCAMLRTAGCLVPDSMIGRILAALAETDFFYDGGVVAGNSAFPCYPLLLGQIPPAGLFNRTDSKLILYTPGIDDIIPVLEARGFEIETCPDLSANGISGWRVNNRIDLEIHQAGRQDFFEFTCLDPFVAIVLHRQGVNIRIPSPERFAIHKLALSQIRDDKSRMEKKKDIAQAEWIMRIMLEKDSVRLCTAWEEARGRGRKWSNFMHAGLAKIPEIQNQFFEKMLLNKIQRRYMAAENELS